MRTLKPYFLLYFHAFENALPDENDRCTLVLPLKTSTSDTLERFYDFIVRADPNPPFLLQKMFRQREFW